MSNLLNVLQSLQGQTITPELLQSLMGSFAQSAPPPPPPPPTQEESVDDLLIAQQVAEHDNRILAAMAAPQLHSIRPSFVDPFADLEFSDSDGEISDLPLDALLSKHNLTAIPDEDDEEISDHDLIDPEIFASIPSFLPEGESEISAGTIHSLLEDGKLFVISDCPPLDVGTSLALNDRSVIAVVVDTFGSVTCPLLLALARVPLSDEMVGRSLITTASLAKQIILDQLSGVFAIRGLNDDCRAIEDLDSDEDTLAPSPEAPRAPSGFSWK